MNGRFKKNKVRVRNASPRGKKKVRRNNPGQPQREPSGKAIELYKGFHDRNDIQVIEENIAIPQDLVFIGKATELNYQSDKWDGISRHYRHKFKTFGNVLADPKGKMIIITGLNFKIKPEGITG